MSCPVCGGSMVGDGHTTLRHCEFARDEDCEGKEADAGPVYCVAIVTEHKLVEVCPQCGKPTIQANIGDDKVDVYCEECGWPDEDFGEVEYDPCLVCGCTEADPDGFCPQCEIAMEVKR